MVQRNSREFTVPAGEFKKLYEQTTRKRTSKYWKLFPVL
jgi:hypothetical protein